MEAACHQSFLTADLIMMSSHLTAQGLVSSEFLRRKTLTQKVCLLVFMRSQAEGDLGAVL